MKHDGENRTWMKLDNAAKIYPPAQTRSWNALFRISVTFDEPVDRDALSRALGRTMKRFPNFAMRLRRGLFWYYLDKLPGQPEIQDDFKNPCARMDFRETGGFSFRVRVFGNRVAVEIFHVITDGAGGLSFVKTLAAEYLEERYGVRIPRGDDLLDCREKPTKEELADAYPVYAGPKAVPEPAHNAYRLRGTRDRDFLRVTTGIIDSAEIVSRAKALGVTVTEYLVTVLLFAAADVKRLERRPLSRRKPVVISVPVNLRKLFGTRTLRNFANYANVGLDTRLGDYTFEEAVKVVHHQLRLGTDKHVMAGKIASNVGIERIFLLRIVPRILKKPIMSLAYRREGDRKNTTSISNLGLVTLPPEMEEHVTRMDFLLGSLVENPVNAAVIGVGGKLYINFTRVIEESRLERAFFMRLVKLGVHVLVESNS